MEFCIQYRNKYNILQYKIQGFLKKILRISRHFSEESCSFEGKKALCAGVGFYHSIQPFYGYLSLWME